VIEEGNGQNKAALSLYAMSQDRTLTAAERFAALKEIFFV
jgi:hypothetical protein